MYPKIRIVLVLILFLPTSISRAQDCSPKISGAVTYSDWIVTANNVTGFLNGITLAMMKTPVGIDSMMSKLKSSGIKRVYWRIYDGGAVTFDAQVKGLNSILNTATNAGFYDFTDIDATFYASKEMSNMEYAIKKAHDNDIEILAWFTLAEEMHSGKCPVSKFAALNYNNADYFEHDLSGVKWKGRLNFANQAVRDHKVDMIKQITNIGDLSNSNGHPSSGETFDGVFLDFTRRGLPDFVNQAEASSCDDQVSSIYDIINTFSTSLLEVRDNNDVSIFGYDAISIQGFNAPIGSIINTDPNWIAHRASYWTTFMQELDVNILKPIISHVFETDAETTLKGDLLDWKEWLKKDYIDGISFLINNTDDGIMIGNYWNDLPDPYTKALTVINDRKIEVQNIKPDAEVIASIYNYTNIPGALLATNYNIIEELTAYAFQAQVNEIMWWETNWFYVWQMYNGTNYNVNEAVIEFGAKSEIDLLISGSSSLSLNDGVIFKEFPIGDDLFNLYKAKNKIVIENYEIQSTGNSYFVACDEIDFLPNFTVNSGEFTAMISKVSQSSYINGNNSYKAVLNIPDDSEQNKDIVVYPNPSSGVISIDNVKSTDILKIQLIDMSGRVLNFKKTTSNDGISLKIQNKGFFILKIETDKAVFSRKVIIN